MANRIVELAIEALQGRKAEIEKEIRSLRAGFRGGLRTLITQRGGSSRTVSKVKRRRPKSAASRKAQSLRMKEYWAKRLKLRKQPKSQESAAQSRAPSPHQMYLTGFQPLHAISGSGPHRS